MKKIILFTLAVMAIMFTACKKDQKTDPVNPSQQDTVPTQDTIPFEPYSIEPAAMADTLVLNIADTVTCDSIDDITFSMEIMYNDTVAGNEIALHIYANYQDSTDTTGIYVVSDMENMPGIVWKSAGVYVNDGDSVFYPTYTYMTVADTAIVNYYFITEGTMTIVNDKMTAVFKTKNGTNIVVNCTIFVAERPAPSMPRRR